MAFLVTLCLVSMAGAALGSVVKTPQTTDAGKFELLILHNNDMHARFEQTSQLSGACTAADRDAGKCYGGFPRVATVVKEARAAAATGDGPPVLYLNAGDTYTGTAWFTIYKWKIAAEFINALQPDAVSLGNHEFDNAVDGLVPFIKNVSTPVLAANLILDKVPEMSELNNLKKSTVLEVNGVSIGVIGYLTPETMYLAPKNDVQYEDEITAIRREVDILKKQNVNVLIALGHSGYIKDLEIAENVDDIDLVIGGHSNTFLTNDETEEKPETRQGPYPKIVVQKSGRKVPVVQAYAYTKYLGKLHLVIDGNGEITQVDGHPILLDNSVQRDPDVLKLVMKYQDEINRISEEVVGRSEVPLDGQLCRLRECTMGNVIADSVLQYVQKHESVLDLCVNIAVIQGGRIRASIDHPGSPFNLTKGDWLTVLPFSDSLTVVSMNGSILTQALEHSVDTWRTVDSTGQFMQVSGIEVVYDLKKKPGNRIVTAKAVNSKCESTELKAIEPNEEYNIVMPSFLADGGDGYTIFEQLNKKVLHYNDITCVTDYLSQFDVIKPKIENRIQILNAESLRSTGNYASKSHIPSSIIYLFLIVVIRLS